MTKKDIEDIIKIICTDDEDFEKPCISPMYLRKELEALALEQEPCEDCCNGIQTEKAKLCQKSYLAGMKHGTCEDAISRQAVIDSIRNYFHDEYYQRTSIQDCRDCLIEDVIKPLPSVMPQPKTGRWIKKEKEFIAPSRFYPIKEIVSTCSICNAHYIGTHEDFKYCPHCGCRTIEGSE